MKSLLASLEEVVSVAPSDRKVFLTIEVLVPDRYREKLRLVHHFPDGYGDIKTRLQVSVTGIKGCGPAFIVQLEGGALHVSIKEKLFYHGFIADYNAKTRTGTLKLIV
ncbi:MAG: hypothetical protein R3B65_03315 [Candidatus Paceibacterota bacterium]